MKEEFSVIGKRVPRVDAVEKATGRGKFTADIRLPGMLFGKVLRSPHPHARARRGATGSQGPRERDNGQA